MPLEQNMGSRRWVRSWVLALAMAGPAGLVAETLAEMPPEQLTEQDSAEISANISVDAPAICARHWTLARQRQQARLAVLQAVVCERELLVQQATQLHAADQISSAELSELGHYLESVQTELRVWQELDHKLARVQRQVVWGPYAAKDEPVFHVPSGKVYRGYQLVSSPEFHAAVHRLRQTDQELAQNRPPKSSHSRWQLLQAHRTTVHAQWLSELAEHCEVIPGAHWYRRNLVQGSLKATTKYVTIQESTPSTVSPQILKRQLLQLTHHLLLLHDDAEVHRELASVAAGRAERRLVRVESLEIRDLPTDQMRYELLAASNWSRRQQSACDQILVRRRQLIARIEELLKTSQAEAVEGTPGDALRSEINYDSTLWETPDFVESYLLLLAHVQRQKAHVARAGHRWQWRKAQRGDLQLLLVDGEVSAAEVADADSHVRQAELELRAAETALRIHGQILAYLSRLTHQPINIADLYWGELPVWEVPSRLVEAFRPTSADEERIVGEIWVIDQLIRDLREFEQTADVGGLSWAERQRWADLETRRQQLSRAQRALNTRQTVSDSDTKLLRSFLEQP